MGVLGFFLFFLFLIWLYDSYDSLTSAQICMKARAFEWLWDIHGYPNLFCHLSFQTGISRGSLSFFIVFVQEPAARLLSLECRARASDLVLESWPSQRLCSTCGC